MGKADRQFSVDMEAAVRLKVEYLLEQATDDIRPLLEMVIAFEIRLEKLLQSAQDASVLDPFELLGEENLWLQATANLLTKPHDQAGSIVLLWILNDLTDHTIRFYQQAAANSSHPMSRIFYSSVAEVKKMIRRKLSNPLRTIYNEVWGQIGFAPFDLTRD